MYLLFEKMVGGRSESKDLQDLWNTIKPHLLRTQMYSYYKERIAILE